MDPAVIATPVVQSDGGAPLGAAAPAGGVPVPAANASAGQQQFQQQHHVSDDGKTVISMPSSAMKRIKDDEREKGRREALGDLAKTAGFGSDLELVQALASLRTQPPQQQQPAPQTQQQVQPPAPTQQSVQPPPADPLSERNNQRAQAKYERDMERLTRERDQYVQKFTTMQNEAKQLREQLDSKEAEMSLREIAVAQGVTDVDYALRLFHREVQNKSEEELSKFDEKTFFGGLRTSRPYLFSEVVRSATTGPGVGGAPTAPKPGAVTTQAAAAGSFDGRKASPADVAARLAKLGLNTHL